MTYDAKAEGLAREASAAKSLLAEIQSDDEALNHDLVEGETNLLEAIDAALSEMDDCDIAITGCKSVEDSIATRRIRAQKRKDRLRGLVEQAMVIADLSTVKRPTATLTVRKVAPNLVITDESLIPSAYWKQPDPILDKAAIKKLTEPVAGTTMSNGGTSLAIRRA